MIDIDVRLYGAFREYSQGKVFRCQLAPGSSLNELRAVLAQQLEVLKPGAASRDLLATSAFADDHDILSESHRLLESSLKWLVNHDFPREGSSFFLVRPLAAGGRRVVGPTLGAPRAEQEDAHPLLSSDRALVQFTLERSCGVYPVQTKTGSYKAQSDW